MISNIHKSGVLFLVLTKTASALHEGNTIPTQKKAANPMVSDPASNASEQETLSTTTVTSTPTTTITVTTTLTPSCSKSPTTLNPSENSRLPSFSFTPFTPFSTRPPDMSVTPLSASSFASSSSTASASEESFSTQSKTEPNNAINSVANSTSTLLPTAAPTQGPCGRGYVVQPGDTCESIWESNPVGKDDLMSLNPQLDGDCAQIQAGQTLCISFSTSSSGTPSFSSTWLSTSMLSSAPGSSIGGFRATPFCGSNHTVADGDTCFGIWTNMKMSKEEFFWLNPKLSVDSMGNCTITRGQVVCVHGPSTSVGMALSTSPATLTTEMGPLTTSDTSSASQPPSSGVLTSLAIIPITTDTPQAGAAKYIRWWPKTSRKSVREDED